MSSLRAPKQSIRSVLQAVLLLMGQRDLSWKSMQLFLRKPSMKTEITNFDAHNITSKMRAKVQKCIDESNNAFAPEVITRASKAAAQVAAGY